MAESTVRWLIVREKHCWMPADSADKSKRTGCKVLRLAHTSTGKRQADKGVFSSQKFSPFTVK
jgi:hypothetical protein